MELGSSVRGVRLIGPKKAAALEAMGVRTLQDALETYPRDYEDRTRIVPIAQLCDGDKVSVCAVVGTTPAVQHVRRGMDLTKLTVFDETGTLQIVYFNNKYVAAQLREGRCYLFYGTIQGEGRQRRMISPVLEPVPEDASPRGRIVPVYPLCAGLTQRDLLRVTDEALAALGNANPPDCLPPYLLQKYALPALMEGLRLIHRPQNQEEVRTARRRLCFEELFLLSCGLARLRERRRDERGLLFKNRSLDAFWRALGFAPTGAQQRATAELTHDVGTGRPMNRLVQGDVGSGKTVVAAALCALAAQNGYQSALMAPTEILAAQHYETLSPLLAKLGAQCVLLTGSMGARDKRDALAALADGRAAVAIGTHALIQKDVQFHNLGAVVADEQHRFGVRQRALLSAKGDAPHVLVMSATPIPRTLALILYGDLDVSVLDELPPGRQPIQTYAVGEEMRTRIYKFIEKQCALGGQAYVVCPLVEDGDLGLKSAEQHAETLRNALPNRRIGLLHGRMKPAEKDETMRAFSMGMLDVLVSTTVIEVGVNVPNATLMIVEDADRFGLSQLHQLRGRVGRGTRQSYCVFFGADKGAKARQRLELLARTADGFEIARADLAMRGPGDFFGARQHGLPPLHVADLAADMALLESAQEEAAALLKDDPELARWPILRARVSRLWRAAEQGEMFN